MLPQKNSPIFILGAHKSGTSLVRSIFDGHSQLNVIPFESHFLKVLGLWIENPFRKLLRSTRTNSEEFETLAIENLKLYHETKNKYADVILSQRPSLDTFVKEIKLLKSQKKDNQKIIQYFSAILKSMKLEISNSRIVEKSVENFEYAQYLKRIFPKAQFIHVLRNPYSNVVSLRRFKFISKGSYPRLDKVIETVNLSYYYAQKNKISIEDYHIIHYENLLSSPEKEIQSLASKLKIKIEPILFSPTSQGLAWKGNSTTGESFDGFKKASNSWLKDIYPIEIQGVNNRMAHVFDFYGYDEISIKKSKSWIPNRREGFAMYCLNRLYVKLLQN